MPSGYEAVRSSVATADLTGRGLIEVRGPQAGKFLQGQTTNDVERLPAGAGCHLAFCDPKGRMLADAHAIRLGDRFLLDMEADRGPFLLDRLRLYLSLAQADMEDEGAGTERLAIVGPGAAAAILERFGAEAPPPGEAGGVFAELGGHPLRILSVPRLGRVPSYHLVASKAATGALERACQELPRASDEAIEVVRIEEGVPRYGAEMTQRTIPQEANLDHALSFTKGCYTGQETIARLHHRGATKRQLTGLDLGDAAPPAFEAEVALGAKVVGWVTSAVRSPALGRTIALGYIRREALAPGTDVRVDGHAGIVRSLPLHPPQAEA